MGGPNYVLFTLAYCLHIKYACRPSHFFLTCLFLREIWLDMQYKLSNSWKFMLTKGPSLSEFAVICASNNQHLYSPTPFLRNNYPLLLIQLILYWEFRPILISIAHYHDCVMIEGYSFLVVFTIDQCAVYNVHFVKHCEMIV